MGEEATRIPTWKKKRVVMYSSAKKGGGGRRSRKRKVACSRPPSHERTAPPPTGERKNRSPGRKNGAVSPLRERKGAISLHEQARLYEQGGEEWPRRNLSGGKQRKEPCREGMFLHQYSKRERSAYSLKNRVRGKYAKCVSVGRRSLSLGKSILFGRDRGWRKKGGGRG